MLQTAKTKQYKARKIRIKQAKQAILIFGVILLIILQFYGFNAFAFSVDVNTNNHQRQTLSLSELYKDETPEYQQQIEIIKELEAYYTQYQEMILFQEKQTITLFQENQFRSGGHKSAPFGILYCNKSISFYNKFVEEMEHKIFSIIDRITVQQNESSIDKAISIDQAIISALNPWKSDLFAARSFISRIKENLIFEDKKTFWYLKHIHRVPITQYDWRGNVKYIQSISMFYSIDDTLYVKDLYDEIIDTDIFNDYFPKTKSNKIKMNQILSILHKLEANYNEYILFLWSVQFAFPEYQASKSNLHRKNLNEALRLWKGEGLTEEQKMRGNSDFFSKVGKHSIAGRMRFLLQNIREVEEITNRPNVAMTQIPDWQGRNDDDGIKSIIHRERILQYDLPRTRRIIRKVVDNAMSDLAIHIQDKNSNVPLYRTIQQFRENTLQLDVNKDLLILDGLFTAFENLSMALQKLFQDAFTQAKYEGDRQWKQYRSDTPWQLLSKEIGNALGRTENNTLAALFEFKYPNKLHELLNNQGAYFQRLYDELRHEMANVMEQIILRYHGKLTWMANFEYTPKVQYNVMKGGKVEKDIGSSVSESFLQFWFRVNRMITDDKATNVEALTTIFKPFILDIVFQISPETARVYGKQFGKLVSPKMEHIPEVECTKFTHDPIGCIDRFFQILPKWWLLASQAVIHGNQLLLYTGIIPVNPISLGIDAFGWAHLQYIFAVMMSDIRVWFHNDWIDALAELVKRCKHRADWILERMPGKKEKWVPYNYREREYPLYSQSKRQLFIYKFEEPLKEDKDIFGTEMLNVQSFNTKVQEIRERMSNDTVSISS